MNTKRFLLSSFVGAIVYFLLGWFVYDVVIPDIYPPTSEQPCFLFYFLGSLSYAMLLSYIFNKWAGISSWASGAKAGALITLFIGLYMNFFMYAGGGIENVPWKNMFLDVVLGMLMGAITGAIIAALSKSKAEA